ncbi:MAG: di-trans,poly-cis-decaprenylcistransferase [Elusimicrobia bacterium GWA2_69_24]|nr:MAG: di-trans,poly-cis-decaprenylcistransferase [Candidatus Rokubacteria bacterium GWC2_70_16]OGK95216.1 MAG: di-trans,poly-cis-decaprenylcistransferase [Candidatus Rokubacteria bacterium RBG_16_73_20]OGR60840.1 MAG: di-trans,poly-cis-decaprenylcistransferase [Elusimicrobia bacterium GWA2_69_24]
MVSLTGPLYRLYAWRLARRIRRGPVPSHVGIILDGNRRYARERGLADLDLAYGIGADKLDEVLAWCVELGIPTLSLWVLSTENLRRPPDEVSGILAAVEAKLGRLAQDGRIRRHAVRVRALGKLELLPDSTLAVIRAAETATAKHQGMTLLIAVAYGGREEIADAVREMLRDKLKQGEEVPALIDTITQEEIARHLYAPDVPDPDLIIRTSGEIRLSGFMLWQSAYSEFYFCDAHWPAFRQVDFLRAVRAYQQRQRRFGR